MNFNPADRVLYPLLYLHIIIDDEECSTNPPAPHHLLRPSVISLLGGCLVCCLSSVQHTKMPWFFLFQPLNSQTQPLILHTPTAATKTVFRRKKRNSTISLLLLLARIGRDPDYYIPGDLCTMYYIYIYWLADAPTYPNRNAEGRSTSTNNTKHLRGGENRDATILE